MTYPICWDATRVREVLTTESRQKARDLFLHTHRPFRQIRVDLCKEADLAGCFVGEEDVYQLVAGGPLDADNRLFFIVGEAGAGKSELCQWLEYRADPDRRLAIHVPRSMTSAAHVAALLRRALGLAGVPPLRRAPIPTQTRHVALSAAVLLYEQANPALTPISEWEALLESRELYSAIAEHLGAAARGDTTHRLLPQPVVPDGSTFDAAAVEAGWPALQRLVAQALEQTLWLGDLREVLGQISAAAVTNGVRPLLLLEDITAFRVLGDRLLDYLLDLSSGHFDAVIGITTGFERTQLAGATLEGDLTHIHHRLRARLVLTDEHGRSYGLDDDVVELARGYLRAVKPDCAACPLHAECDEVFGPDLYPFTEIALRRALAALHEEGNPRQTPRLFLEHVLGASLLSSEPPPAALDRSAYLAAPPALFRADDAPNPALRGLLRWYGEVSEEAVSLDARILDFWSVVAPQELVLDKTVRVARSYVVPLSGTPAPSALDWQAELRELQVWLDKGGLYPSRETLKQGVERALFALGDPRALRNSDSISISRAEIIYARGDERIPIALGRGSGDQSITRASPKVLVRGLPEERSVLEELAYVSLSGAELAQVCQNLALTLEWAQAHFDAYQADVRRLLTEQLGGLSVEGLILAAWRMVAGLCGDSQDGPPDLRPREDLPDRYAELAPWSPTEHWTCHAAGAELIVWRETLRRLYIGAFTLRDTLLDRSHLDAALASFDPVAALERLSELPLSSLRAMPFRIRPTGQRLYDLIAPLQRYAVALRRLDVVACLRADAADLALRAAHLDAQVELNRAELHQQLGALRWRCGEVGVVWREGWDGALELLSEVSRDEMHSLREHVVASLQAAEAQLREAPSNVWAYQRLRQLARPALIHAYWGAAETIGIIQAELQRSARARYRSAGKVLSGTPAYKALLLTIRDIREELRDG